MSTRPSRLATFLLLLALVVPVAQAAPVYGAPGGPPGPTQSTDRPSTRAVPERWIVRLAGPPLAQAPGVAPGVCGHGPGHARRRPAPAR